MRGWGRRPLAAALAGLAILGVLSTTGASADGDGSAPVSQSTDVAPVRVAGGPGRGPAVEIPQMITRVEVANGLLYSTSAGGDGAVRVTNLESGWQEPVVWRGDDILALAVAPDGTAYWRDHEGYWTYTAEGALASFPGPASLDGLAVTADGVVVIYRYDSWTNRSTLLRLEPDGDATPIVTINGPLSAVEGDRTGAILVAAGTSVLRVGLDGSVVAVAGGGTQPPAVGVPATSATFRPIDHVMAADGTAFHLIADGRLTSVDGTGTIVSDVAVPGFSTWNHVIAADADGDDVYYALDQSIPADTGSRERRQLRRMSPPYNATTVVVGSTKRSYIPASGVATDAVLPHIDSALGMDPAGNWYIPLPDDGVVAKLTPDGVMSRFAGGGTATGSGVAATDAQLPRPCGAVADHAGNVYIGDRGPFPGVYRVAPDGTMSRYAGREGPEADPSDPQRVRLTFRVPCRLALDDVGRLIVFDGALLTDRFQAGGVNVRRIEANGAATLILAERAATYTTEAFGDRVGSTTIQIGARTIRFDPGGAAPIQVSRSCDGVPLGPVDSAGFVYAYCPGVGLSRFAHDGTRTSVMTSHRVGGERLLGFDPAGSLYGVGYEFRFHFRAPNIIFRYDGVGPAAPSPPVYGARAALFETGSERGTGWRYGTAFSAVRSTDTGPLPVPGGAGFARGADERVEAPGADEAHPAARASTGAAHVALFTDTPTPVEVDGLHAFAVAGCDRSRSVAGSRVARIRVGGVDVPLTGDPQTFSSSGFVIRVNHVVQTSTGWLVEALRVTTAYVAGVGVRDQTVVVGKVEAYAGCD